MKNTTLTITFNTEKLDALFFHMGKKDANLQEELNDIIQKLYEKYVPLATREYIDDRVSRVEEARNTGRRQSMAKFGKGQDSGEKEDGTRSKCVRVKGRVA